MTSPAVLSTQIYICICIFMFSYERSHQLTTKRLAISSGWCYNWVQFTLEYSIKQKTKTQRIVAVGGYLKQSTHMHHKVNLLQVIFVFLYGRKIYCKINLRKYLCRNIVSVQLKHLFVLCATQPPRVSNCGSTLHCALLEEFQLFFNEVHQFVGRLAAACTRAMRMSSQENKYYNIMCRYTGRAYTYA